MKYRKLRIAWSVAWGVVALLSVGLWARSYWWQDILTLPVTDGILVSGVSHQGSTYLSATYSDVDTLGIQLVKFELQSLSAKNAAPMPKGWDAGWQTNPVPAAFALCPHWFAASVVTLVAVAPWLPHRFSLRTLLIATTVIAVALGIIVWMSRAG